MSFNVSLKSIVRLKKLQLSDPGLWSFTGCPPALNAPSAPEQETTVYRTAWDVFQHLSESACRIELWRRILRRFCCGFLVSVKCFSGQLFPQKYIQNDSLMPSCCNVNRSAHTHKDTQASTDSCTSCSCSSHPCRCQAVLKQPCLLVILLLYLKVQQVKMAKLTLVMTTTLLKCTQTLLSSPKFWKTACVRSETEVHMQQCPPHPHFHHNLKHVRFF